MGRPTRRGSTKLSQIQRSEVMPPKAHFSLASSLVAVLMLLAILGTKRKRDSEVCLVPSPGQLLRLLRIELESTYVFSGIELERIRLCIALLHKDLIPIILSYSTFQGIFLRMWGNRGEADGDMNHPKGIAIHNNEIFVADASYHRIQVFNQHTGRFLRKFGQYALLCRDCCRFKPRRSFSYHATIPRHFIVR